MKKTVWLALALLLVCVLGLSACDTLNLGVSSHVHMFGEWTQVKAPTCTEGGITESRCSCGQI